MTLFETLGYAAVTAGIVSLVFASRYYRSATHAGHRFYARIAIAAIALSTIASTLFLYAGLVSGGNLAAEIFRWAGSLRRTSAIINVVTFAIFVGYMGRAYDPSRNRRSRRRRRSDDPRHPRIPQSDARIGGVSGRERPQTARRHKAA